MRRRKGGEGREVREGRGKRGRREGGKINGRIGDGSDYKMEKGDRIGERMNR